MVLIICCLSADSDFENANRSADVDVELMAFQSIIGDDYKGDNLTLREESWSYDSMLCSHMLF